MKMVVMKRIEKIVCKIEKFNEKENKEDVKSW